jgi:DNA-directed RNA polymerase subunit RPC12/RpoP
MAQCFRFVCQNCGKAIDAWSDGNPYYIDDSGQKQYAYHPQHERLASCVGNDLPHLCLACGEQFVDDSRAPMARCPKCESRDISRDTEVGGRQCPWCTVGLFDIDPDFFCIS